MLKKRPKQEEAGERHFLSHSQTKDIERDITMVIYSPSAPRASNTAVVSKPPVSQRNAKRWRQCSDWL